MDFSSAWERAEQLGRGIARVSAGLIGMASTIGDWDMVVNRLLILALQLVGINCVGALVFHACGLTAHGTRYTRGKARMFLAVLAVTLGALAGLLLWGGAAEERRDLEEVIRAMLIVGLVISTALMLTGIGLDLVTWRITPIAVLDIDEGFGRLSVAHSFSFLAMGLFMLIATPILSVGAAILALLYEHDSRYAGITTLVLIILVVSWYLVPPKVSRRCARKSQPDYAMILQRQTLRYQLEALCDRAESRPLSRSG